MALHDDYGSLLGVLNAQPDMWKYINTDETIKQIMAQSNGNAQAQQSVVGAIAGAQQGHLSIAGSQVPEVGGALTPIPSKAQAIRAKELFVNRMKGVRGNFKFMATDFLETHIHSDTVLMFYCFDGREGIVKEPIDVWPSDTLIAQFRMILA